MVPHRSSAEARQRYRLYGLRVASDFPFTTSLAPGGREPEVDLTIATASPQPDLLAGAECAYESPFLTDDGRSDYVVYRRSDGDVLSYAGAFDFHVQPEQITAYLHDPALTLSAEIQLLGVILSYWLERSGIPALHASAVSVGGTGVAFLASRRGGKSTLAATMVQAGYPLLTDDLLPLALRDGVPVGRPGYPQMRLWPDQALHFLGHYDLPLVHPSVAKRRVRIGRGGWGAFADAAVPIAGLYVPQRRDPSDPSLEIEIHPVSPRDALRQLIGHSFIPRTVEALGWQPRRIATLAHVVERVPMRRLVYPNGTEHLPCVRETILKDLEMM